jgi:hypothetical protein
LAHARHLHETGAIGELPPLDATFFDRAVELGVKVPPTLREYALDILGADPFATGTPKPRMEDFFKDVYYDFIQEAEKDRHYASLYGQLVVIYRAVLLRTTNWVCDGVADGPVSALLASVADAARQVDVITFNHDLVIENALAELSGARTRWCLRHGYGHFASRRHLTVQAGVDVFDDPQTCKHPDPIRIFKLHGSLNWYVDTDSDIPDAPVLRGQREAGQRIRITRRRRVPVTLRRKGTPWSWPILIPPIYAKQSFISNFMAPVWQDARGAVAACDKLVFYGYSLPQLDIEAEKEFQRAIARNSRLRHVDVVNPDSGVATRYAAAFPQISVRWHGDLERYLASSPMS